MDQSVMHESGLTDNFDENARSYISGVFLVSRSFIPGHPHETRLLFLCQILLLIILRLLLARSV